MGIGHQASTVHVIDFGLSKEFRSPDTHLHIPLCQGMKCGLTRPVLFMSNNSHTGCELGRWDDLKSLAYVLIYVLCGGLPWEGLANSDLIAQHKLESSTKDLCDGLPIEYAMLLSYSWTLPFDAKPNYNYISGLFGRTVPHEGTNTVFDLDSGLAHHINAPYTKLLPLIIALHMGRAQATPIHHAG